LYISYIPAPILSSVAKKASFPPNHMEPGSHSGQTALSFPCNFHRPEKVTLHIFLFSLEATATVQVHAAAYSEIRSIPFFCPVQNNIPGFLGTKDSSDNHFSCIP